MMTIRKVIWVVIIMILIHMFIRHICMISVRVTDCKPNGNEAGYVCSFMKDGKSYVVVSTQFCETNQLIYVTPYLMDKTKFYMESQAIRMMYKVALVFLVFLDIVMMYEEQQQGLSLTTPQPGSSFRSFFRNFGQKF